MSPKGVKPFCALSKRLDGFYFYVYNKTRLDNSIFRHRGEKMTIIRGATTIERDCKDEIFSSVKELVDEIFRANFLKKTEVRFDQGYSRLPSGKSGAGGRLRFLSVVCLHGAGNRRGASAVYPHDDFYGTHLFGQTHLSEGSKSFEKRYFVNL